MLLKLKGIELNYIIKGTELKGIELKGILIQF